jgi:hypothetical protein
VLKPLDATPGQTCFQLGTSAGSEVGASFDKVRADSWVLGRLEMPFAAGIRSRTGSLVGARHSHAR